MRVKDALREVIDSLQKEIENQAIENRKILQARFLNRPDGKNNGHFRR
jgi:hypothetical protein